MMMKVRTFQKKLTIDNFKELKTANLHQAGRGNAGKVIRETATIVAEVFYTPKGFRCEALMHSPVFAWDFQHGCRIEGISDTTPDGDLADKNFETALAAMHFITRRLKRLGWEPVDAWNDQ